MLHQMIVVTIGDLMLAPGLITVMLVNDDHSSQVNRLLSSLMLVIG